MGRDLHQDNGATQEVSGLSRRTVTKGAAWATPLLVTAVAVPAYAASGPCVGGAATPLVIGTKPAQLTFIGSPVTATVGFVATRPDGTSVTPLPGGGDAQYETGEVAADGQIAMVFDEPDDQQNLTLTMTLTFSQQVTGLELTITDIDKTTGLWIDWVVISPAGFTVPAKGSFIDGDGTAAFSGMPAALGPFRSNNEGELPDSDARAKLTVRWPTAVQEVQVKYLPGDLIGDSAGGQHIGIGAIAFASC